MEETRFDRIQDFTQMHATARTKAGKSQEYMAAEMNVSKKTVQNWEKGISSPTFFQSLEWFRILNINPFPLYLELVYPKKLKGLKSSDSEEKTNEAFDALVETLPLSAKQALLYLFFGEHGSNPNAVIQLLLAHLHTPRQTRVVQSLLTAHMYEIEQERGNLICENDIMPNMETLNEEIMRARISAIHKEYGCSNIFEMTEPKEDNNKRKTK